MTTTLPCIVCDKPLKSAFQEQDLLKETRRTTTSNQPSNGTCFQSHGNYGSTVFDPVVGNIFAELNLCDECWKIKKADGAIKIFNVRTTHEYIESTEY